MEELIHPTTELQIKEDDDHHDGGNSVPPIKMLTEEKSSNSTRTLLDIIRDDPTIGHKDNKKSWKHFKEKLKLRRAGSGAGSSWTSAFHVPTSDIPLQQQHGSRTGFARRASTRYAAPSEPDPNEDPHSESSYPEASSDGVQQNRVGSNTLTRSTSRTVSLSRSKSCAPDRQFGRSVSNVRDFAEQGHGKPSEEEEVEEEEGGSEEGEGRHVRTSLMALLADGDQEMGLSAFIECEDEEDEESGGGGGDDGEEYSCCVCMVKHKGAAFAPCGHTFCRLCSRELWVQRGNCPLCHGFVTEILDIF